MVKRRKRCPPEGAADWLLTYGDMTTLLLTFFVLMFTTATIDGYKLRLILAAFPGLGNYQGGNTLEEGRLAELGHSVMSLPSVEVGRALSEARRNAVSIFEPEIRSQKVRITEDERGLVISLAGDAFFEPASAEVDIEETRDILFRLSKLLTSEILSDRTFRIEGHTDSVPTDPNGPWPSNWHLGAERALSVFRYLIEFSPNPDEFEEQFQVMSLGDTVPLADNSTVEGRAYNRRVDLVILTEGHL